MSEPLGLRMRDLRLRAGVSQRELGRRLGVDGSHITRLENGQRSPSYGLLVRWAAACGAEASVIPERADLDKALDVLDMVSLDMVRRFAEALAKVPAPAPGARHPGDLAIAVLAAAAVQ